jgi:CYTH domain-containing protein
MAREIERKFLVRLPVELPGEEVTSSVVIDQGYLTPRGADVEVRLRRGREVTSKSASEPAPASQTGAHGIYKVWKMTVKVSPRDTVTEPGLEEIDAGLDREEIEATLSEEEFDRLWPRTAGRRIKKVRTSFFLLKSNGETLDACLDDFRGDLSGLAMVEVEFGGEEEAAAFVAPPFFEKEVTDDPRYRNDALADADEPPEER